GVEAAGLIQVLPIQNWGWNSEIHVTGTPPAPTNEVTLAEDRIITPGYYDVFKDRLVRGRLLDPKVDTRSSRPVIVVNEAFVKKFIPAGRDPIGMQIDQDDHNTIVGVVKNIRQNIYEPPLAEMDFMAAQVPPGGWEMQVLMGMNLVVRTKVAPESIVPS